MTSFGVALPQAPAMRDGRFDVEAWIRLVQRAEELGFREVVVADHVFVPSYWANVIGGFFVDPVTLLSFVAARTTRIRLVIGCLVVPYRQPFGVAKMMATLDQLSGGRSALGIVPGYLREEFEAFALPLEERNQMTAEFVEIMRRLWTSDDASFQGRYHSFEHWNLQPKCVQSPHVPIWVGGSSRGAITRAVEFGDVWHPLGFTVVHEEYRVDHEDELAGKTLPTSGTTPDRLREGLAHAARLADAAGRDLSSLEVVVMPGPPPADVDGRLPSNVTGSSAARGGQRTIDWLAEYVDAGATGFVMGVGGATIEKCTANLEVLASEVVARLAGAGTAPG